MLLTLQQFADSNFSATPFVALDDGQCFPDDRFTRINGQTLMSARALLRDAWRLKDQHGRDRVKVPGHGRRKNGPPPPIKMASGKSLLPGQNGRSILSIRTS